MSDGECEQFPIKGTEKNEIITFTGEFGKKLDLYRHSPLTLDDAKANLTLRHLGYELKSLPNVIVNENVDGSCLGKKGLHLNPKGSGRLSVNYISLMRRF